MQTNEAVQLSYKMLLSFYDVACMAGFQRNFGAPTSLLRAGHSKPGSFLRAPSFAVATKLRRVCVII